MKYALALLAALGLAACAGQTLKGSITTPYGTAVSDGKTTTVDVNVTK